VSHALFHPERIGRITLAFFVAPLLFALFAGRVFCGSVCPLGAIQHFVFRRSRSIMLPTWLDRTLMIGPWLVLAATIWNSVRGPSFLVCRLDPFVTAFLYGKASIIKLLSVWGFGFSEPAFPQVGDGLSWAFLCGSLVLCMLVALSFCRYVCPLGAILGLVSLVSFKQRAIDQSRCTNCQRCRQVCPTQAITAGHRQAGLRVSLYKCVQCGRCDEVCRCGAFHAANRTDLQ
jgi:polyferredoxin